ncbi:TRAP transporter TatT component family protein [Polyangium sp. 15x6]|uniref:TRAP transporter TatT component family protein n=1 Tax=Polyangium sp. 15x6 TaxID=3042687 RepID=UPI00249B60AD|nr:TRAP transporter TatT component family protein [Polyangium sp. 15x6]MDI3291072.1 TRAP transporter TatT component family protein [Polyangium sp. 15x6]
MRPFQTLSVLALSALSLASTGCIKKMFLEGQIEATATASAAIDTMTDYEVAKVVAFNGIGQFEGMHYLAPDNEDALFALVKTWTSATFAFTEDELEQAEDEEGLEGPRYLHLRNRAAAAYDRGLRYGLELLETYHPGFEGARKNDDTMRAYTAQFTDPERDAPALFWAGYAWISKTNILKDDPAAVGDLFIGVALMERSVALDPKYMAGSGHTILGAYHARTAMAELDEAKKHFDQSLAIHGGKMLLTKVQYAAKYHCFKGDKDSYVKALTEVVEAGDVFPEQRLANVVAKRRAVRYLGKVRMRECGF